MRNIDLLTVTIFSFMISICALAALFGHALDQMPK